MIKSTEKSFKGSNGLAINANKAAIDLKEELIKTMTDPKIEATITIGVVV